MCLNGDLSLIYSVYEPVEQASPSQKILHK